MGSSSDSAVLSSLPAGAGTLPDRLLEQLGHRFRAKHVTYIARVLGAEELDVIRDLSDALIIARIKRMSSRRLRRYDRFVPVNRQEQEAFERAQLQWLEDEQYLLGRRLGHSPSHGELLADFVQHQNGLRFRAYYTMKHPHRMKRLTEIRTPVPQSPAPAAA